MKTRLLIVAITIVTAFCSCSKEEQVQPQQNNPSFNFNGRLYEHLEGGVFTSYRTYSVMDFISSSNFTSYNGMDSLGIDGIWHRLEPPMGKTYYAYKVFYDNGNKIITYLSNSPYNETDCYNSASRHVYDVDDDENGIFFHSKKYIRIK